MIGLDGKLVEEHPLTQSGNGDFETAIRDVLADAAPLPAPPRALASDDELVHVRWQFARDRRAAVVEHRRAFAGVGKGIPGHNDPGVIQRFFIIPGPQAVNKVPGAEFPAGKSTLTRFQRISELIIKFCAGRRELDDIPVSGVVQITDTVSDSHRTLLQQRGVANKEKQIRFIDCQ